MEAVQLCIRWGGEGAMWQNVGEWRYTEKRKQGWWTEEVAEAMGEKREAWKMIECIKDRGEQPPTSLKHLYGHKKKAARRAVDRARSTEEYGGRTVPKA